MRFNSRILCFILFVCTEAEAGNVGDPCKPTQQISDGQCTLVTDCEVAIRHIREDFTHPFRRCGFIRILEVVCCPKKPSPGVATTKRAVTTSTNQSVVVDDFSLQTSPISPSMVPEKLGDPCVPTQYISEGKCKLVSECEIALSTINEKDTHPFKRCGFLGMMEIICCPTPPVQLDDGAKENPKDYKTTNSTGSVETWNNLTPIAEKPSENLTTIAEKPSKNLTTIAEKQCEKIKEKTLPPVSLHIIGGRDAAPGEFPHMVALGYDNRGGIAFQCGGSLISENFILTAAHCADNRVTRVKPTVARMGVVNLGEDEFNPLIDVKIAEVIIHPDYKSLYKYHDVALLRLERPVDYSETLVPACLYTGDDTPNVALTITGWGKTAYNKDGGSEVLQKANVTAVSRARCTESYGAWRRLPDGIARGQLCAGDVSGARDSCQGDSGGPLQGLTAADGYYRIIGITSFGRGCGSVVPGVYTQVSFYREWIESVVWRNEYNAILNSTQL